MNAPTPDQRFVQIDAASLTTDEATKLVSGSLREATDRGHPFVALVWMPPSARGRVGLGDVTERVRMLKRIRPGLRDWCRGLAFLVTQDTLTSRAKAIRSGDRLWGCPTFTTADEAAARAWISERLAGLDAEEDQS